MSPTIRFELDMVRNINKRHEALRQSDPQLEARIQAFELAFRMQAEAPNVFRVESESDATKKLYGLDDPMTRILHGNAFSRGDLPKMEFALFKHAQL
jgi:hypothetical protein